MIKDFQRTFVYVGSKLILEVKMEKNLKHKSVQANISLIARAITSSHGI